MKKIDKKSLLFPQNIQEEKEISSGRIENEEWLNSKLENSFSRKRKRSDELSTTSDKKAYGRWNIEEKQAFREALEKYGKKWKKVEAYVGTRSGTQIRSYAQKFFLNRKVDKHKQVRTDTIVPIAPEKLTPHTKIEENIVEENEVKNVEKLEEQCNTALNSLSTIISQYSSLTQNLKNVRTYFEEIKIESLNLSEKTEGELKGRCKLILGIAEFEIKEIDTCLSQYTKAEVLSTRTECPYLAQHIAKFNLNNINGAYTKLQRLDDWVDTQYLSFDPLARYKFLVSKAMMNKMVHRTGET